MKKGEAWLNTFTTLVTYVMRCNIDITSLLSGTAIKSVITYITDYITKSPLKTHTIFEAVRSIFAKNEETNTEENINCLQKTRKVITWTVNALTSQSEIGSPMSAMYLLKNPDHYKSHQLQCFYWKPYFNEVRQAWENYIASKIKESDLSSDNINKPSTDTIEPRMVLSRNKNGIVAVSPVLDYVHRPEEYQNINLFDWIQLSKKNKDIT